MNQRITKKSAAQAVMETTKQGESVWTEWHDVDKLCEKMKQHAKQLQRDR